MQQLYLVRVSVPQFEQSVGYHLITTLIIAFVLIVIICHINSVHFLDFYVCWASCITIFFVHILFVTYPIQVKINVNNNY